MKVVVTGASGLLGEEIADFFSEENDVIALKGRKQIDITKTDEIFYFLKEINPDLIIHSAGWRAVDDCEKNKEQALLINSLGTKNIALAAKSIGCPMIHISTDSVFDGETDKPYTEFDSLKPVNVYGYSKLKAEESVISILDKYFIVRVPILFGNKGKKEDNLILNVWDKIERGEKIYAALDQVCSPTYTRDVAYVLSKMAKTEYYGVYHVANEGVGSRYDLMKEIAEIKGYSSENIIPYNSEMKYAKRPKFTVFNGIAFYNTFGIKLRDWKIALKECIESISKS
jgi:dTDP-4-dehydrorhamnose reductase